ncbi:MAG: lipocalin family protein [Candidatus Azobacteroides sp.]|nr:lipocalin family protein [Candidatus Azobacteroides sp.]
MNNLKMMYKKDMAKMRMHYMMKKHRKHMMNMMHMGCMHKKQKHILICSAVGGALLAAGVVLLIKKKKKALPKDLKVVEPFDASRYMGKWYEIARMDYIHEKNLINTTAEYSLNQDGTVTVVNRGYNYKKEKEEQVTGKAKFAEYAHKGKLKVSFFGPFYDDYNVIALDDDYKYAMVAGKNLDYLWLLSRETTIPYEVQKDFLSQAEALGYNIDKLTWVEQGC